MTSHRSRRFNLRVGVAVLLLILLGLYVVVILATDTPARADGGCVPVSPDLQGRMNGTWPLPRVDRAELIQR